MAPKKKRQKFVRTTVSLPADLLKRMKDCGDDVNWSAVAVEAFAAKVASINTKKENAKMEDVIDRLLASQRKNATEQFEAGRKAGEEWAKRHAEAVELQRLQKAWDTIDFQYQLIETWLDWGDQNPPPAEQFWTNIKGTSAGDSSDDFWEAVLGEDEKHQSEDSEFVHGFASGALDVWSEVADKL
jgi:hypothetical protein